MADLPRDPRQLARDILSGKISIEDLAREQARRRAAQLPGNAGAAKPQSPLPPPTRPAPPPQASSPQQIPPPLKRPVPPHPAPPRPAGMPRPGQSQRPQPPRPVGGASGRPTNRPVPPGPTKVPATPMLRSANRPAMSGERSAPSLGAPQQVAEITTDHRRMRITDLAASLHDPKALRRAIVLAEILGKPLALRKE